MDRLPVSAFRRQKSELRDVALNVELSCLLLNARSVCNKLNELLLVIDESKSKIILISETWLHEEFTDSMLSMKGRFNVYRKDRIGKRGGGVCALVCCDLDSAVVCIPDRYAILDVVAFDLSFPSCTYRIITGYRPPEYDKIADKYAQEFCECIKLLTATKHTCILAGDLNLPLMQWENYVCPGDKVNAVFAETFQMLGFSQFVLTPTRGDRILDVILILLCLTVICCLRLEVVTMTLFFLNYYNPCVLWRSVNMRQLFIMTLVRLTTLE